MLCAESFLKLKDLFNRKEESKKVQLTKAENREGLTVVVGSSSSSNFFWVRSFTTIFMMAAHHQRKKKKKKEDVRTWVVDFQSGKKAMAQGTNLEMGKKGAGKGTERTVKEGKRKEKKTMRLERKE